MPPLSLDEGAKGVNDVVIKITHLRLWRVSQS
jgi:hypothetical protein